MTKSKAGWVCLFSVILLNSCRLYAAPSKNGVTASPATLSFGSVAVNTVSSPSTVTLTNTSNRTISVASAASSLTEFVLSSPSLPVTLTPGTSASFTVVFRPNSAGSFSGNLSFRIGHASSSYSTLVATVTGTGAASSSSSPTPTYLLSPNPTALNFGNVNLGSTSNQAVSLTNTGNSAVSISQVTTTGGAGFTTSGISLPMNLAAGQSASLNVTFTPTQVGSVIGSVTVVSDASNSPSIALSAAAVRPQISIVPSSVSFGNVTVGATNTQTMTLTNQGTANLNVSQATVSGSACGMSGYTMPMTLAPGKSGTLTVSFKPTVAGSSSGSLAVVSNDPSSPAAVTLSGSGVAASAQLAASPTSLSFANVSVGSSSSQTVTLNNSGNSSASVSQLNVSGAGFTASGLTTPLSLAAGQSTTFTVAFAPTAAGSVSGNISVTSNATNSPTKVSLSGTGAIPTTSSAPLGLQFYVSTTGNDTNSGTSTGSAWRTIQHAMSNATAGSTVNIMAGNYQEELTMSVSGTSGNPITFQPYNFSIPAGGCGGYTGVACGGDQVVLDYSYLGTNTSTTPFFHISGKSYITVQGLTFQNFTCTGAMQQGLRIDGSSSNVIFQYNKFLNLKNTGGLTGSTALLAIRVWVPATNITFQYNEEGNVWTTSSEAMTFDGGGTIGNMSSLVQYNYMHDTDQLGMTTYNGAGGVTFAHNKLLNISVQANGTVYYNNPSTGIYIDGGGPDTIDGNWISNAGLGIEAQSEPGITATHDVIVRNNVVLGSKQSGIVIGTWYSNNDGSSVYNINVWNNTFYKNSPNVTIRPMVSSTIVWVNNIFYGSSNYANSLNWNPGTATYNLYFGGNGGPGSNNLTSDPLFVSPSIGNFSLQSTSPAISAGYPASSTNTVGTVDFLGNPRMVNGQIDIGAFEVP